jgi:L-lysine exporter family protein LysE/ArgO
MSIFFQGFLTGLAYVMPIGAQNVFLIHSSLRVKAPKNFLIAFYVLLADVSLAMICYFGLGKILTLNLFVRLVFSILGSLVLFKMGINLIISKESAVNSGFF